MFQIDTSNVLFILSGAFVGLETIIKRRVAKGVRLFDDILYHPYDDICPVNRLWSYTQCPVRRHYPRIYAIFHI